MTTFTRLRKAAKDNAHKKVQSNYGYEDAEAIQKREDTLRAASVEGYAARMIVEATHLVIVVP